MSSGILVAIKIEHQSLIDFITSTYGEEPVPVTKANKLSSMFIKGLTTAPTDFIPVLKNKPGYLLFELPYNDEKNIRCNYFITEKNQKFIIDFFESEFKTQFRLFMNKNIQKLSKYQQDVIFEFTRVYNVECDQNVFDLLKKDYYRYRKRLDLPMLKIRGAKTYKEAQLKKKNLTTFDAALSLTCP